MSAMLVLAQIMQNDKTSDKGSGPKYKETIFCDVGNSDLKGETVENQF